MFQHQQFYPMILISFWQNVDSREDILIVSIVIVVVKQIDETYKEPEKKK